MSLQFFANPYPWRCLWRGFVQMTQTRPRRFTVRQRMQIFFTDALTFMTNLQSFYDAGTAAVWIKLNDHAVADEHFNAMQAHFACKIRENSFLGRKLYAK